MSIKKIRILFYRRVIFATIAVMIVFCLCCASPGAAAKEAPEGGEGIRVETRDRFTGKDGNSGYDITVAMFEGLPDHRLEKKLNRELLCEAKAVLERYKDYIKENAEECPEATLQVVHSYEVVTDTDDILALKVTTFEAVGSSNTTNKFYTIDKKTGERLTLPRLFKEGADYVTPISNYIREEMIRRNNSGEGGYLTDDFQAIGPEQNFYINSEGQLVIAFDKYEVAAGAVGTPEFVIPDEVIKDILK
ncbi:MAG: DUF3298 and DUF4163 domain-containing protein [Oscillospiraceae bacterium]|jgi:hypothetical protein|nr:DUF3298 and DUF4163 domain-containing protein [Oscillospiraceae bacterium]